MNPEAAELGIEIARCPIIQATLRGEDTPCRQVVSWLGSEPGPRYLAEPWSGHLTEAPVLFVSSNPSAGNQDDPVLPEDWTTSESSDEDILAATDGGFDERQRPGVVDGIYLLDRQGRRANTRPVRYWVWNKRIARELLGREPEPGRDYALTEVVHCPSQAEFGVWEALETCARRYLERVLRASAARVLILTGDKALWAFEQVLQVKVEGHLWGPNEIVGRQRIVLSLPHPNRRGSLWGLDPYLGPDGASRVREFLGGA